MRKWSKTVSRAVAGMLVTGMLVGTLHGGVSAEAAQYVKKTGYENGVEVNIRKAGSYVSGYSNMDGGVAEIISYDTKNQKAW